MAAGMDIFQQIYVLVSVGVADMAWKTN